jgi:hypothetical protein
MDKKLKRAIEIKNECIENRKDAIADDVAYFSGSYCMLINEAKRIIFELRGEIDG